MSIYDSSGVSTQEAIQKAHVDFYSSFFSEEPIDSNLQSDILYTLSCHLSFDQASLCEGAVSANEITAAVNGMNANKSPGPDGLTVEFYRKF